MSCEYNNKETVELLINKYPDIINQKDDEGYTGFLVASL